MEEQERKKRFLLNVTYMIFVLGIYYVLVRYVMYALMPFTIAFLVTAMLKRPVDFVSRKLHLPRKGVAIVLVILFYGLIGALLANGIFQLILAIMNWFGSFNTVYADTIEPAVERLVTLYESVVANLDPEHFSQAQFMADNLMNTLTNGVTSLSRLFVGYAQRFATGTPKFLISLIFCIVSTVFLSVDFPNITYFFMAQFSEKNQQTILEAKSYLTGTIGKMLKSYSMIMGITCCELLIGLKLIGVEDFVVLAVVIAIFDILPALGTGGVLIPWAAIEIVQGEVAMGVELLVLYGVITVVRNIIEPKIVGETVGLHPVLLLISIYIGGSLLGPLGIIILPFTLIVIKKLNDAGHIHLFNSSYLDDRSEDFQQNYKTNSIVVDEAMEREKLRG